MSFSANHEARGVADSTQRSLWFEYTSKKAGILDVFVERAALSLHFVYGSLLIVFQFEYNWLSYDSIPFIKVLCFLIDLRSASKSFPAWLGR